MQAGQRDFIATKPGASCIASLRDHVNRSDSEAFALASQRSLVTGASCIDIASLRDHVNRSDSEALALALQRPFSFTLDCISARGLEQRDFLATNFDRKACSRSRSIATQLHPFIRLIASRQPPQVSPSKAASSVRFSRFEMSVPSLFLKLQTQSKAPCY